MARDNPDFRRWAKVLRPKEMRVEDLPKSRQRGRLLMTPRLRGTKVEVVQTPVPVRLIRPDETAAGRGPAMLWIHGGGYVGGRARMDDRLCSRYARDLALPVASVDYRLAPEDPFPVPLDDCFTALEWLCRQPWADPKRIVIGGASAGGGLAAALVQRAVDAGIEVCFQLLVYPMLDDRVGLREDIGPDDHLVWNTVSNRFGWQCYLGTAPGGEELPAYAAPGRRTDLTGLPPAWIGVGTADLFYDEDVDYSRRLEAAGVPCRLVTVPNGIHAFERLAWWRVAAKDFVASQIASVRDSAIPLDNLYLPGLGEHAALETAPVTTSGYQQLGLLGPGVLTIDGTSTTLDCSGPGVTADPAVAGATIAVSAGATLDVTCRETPGSAINNPTSSNGRA